MQVDSDGMVSEVHREGSQAATSRDDGVHQFVGVEIALHQQSDFAITHERNSQRRSARAICSLD